MLEARDLDLSRVVAIAADLCAADVDEMTASGIDDAVGMLSEALPCCSWVQELVWDGQTVAIFGVRPHEGIGIPWMLTTTRMDAADRDAVAQTARRVVHRMRREFTRLANLVHRRNVRAIRFIEALQFTVHREPCGPGGEFFLFDWERR